MEPNIELCEEQGINIFLGKCTHTDSYKVCPGDPVVVEHLKPDHHESHEDSVIPHGCHRGHDGRLMCPSDLHKAFEHGSSCFQVDHRFICEDDLDHIKKHMCVDVGKYEVCGHELFSLFQGEKIHMKDGHELVADFSMGAAVSHHDNHSGMCRTDGKETYCLENVMELYQPPHDCVMFAGEWIC